MGAGDRAYLLSLVESLAVTVGQVHGTGHHPRAGFELLQGSLHVSAAGALCVDRRDERYGRTRWKPPTCAEHVAWAAGGKGGGGRRAHKGSVGKATTFCPKTFPPSHLLCTGCIKCAKPAFDQAQRHTVPSVRRFPPSALPCL